MKLTTDFTGNPDGYARQHIPPDATKLDDVSRLLTTADTTMNVYELGDHTLETGMLLVLKHWDERLLGGSEHFSRVWHRIGNTIPEDGRSTHEQFAKEIKAINQMYKHQINHHWPEKTSNTEDKKTLAERAVLDAYRPAPQYKNFDPNVLVGRQIVDTNTQNGTLTLDDGTIIEFETEITDCCSYLSLTDLHTTTSIITAAGIKDDEDEDSLDSQYNAWVYAITDGGEKAIVEAEGDAMSGYYIHGFELKAKIYPPDQE